MANSYPITLSQKEIKEIIPHREPFLFLDGGEILGPLTSRGWVTFPEDWNIFVGHFPGLPVVPGVILQEILGQTTSLIIKVIPECQGLIGIFKGVKSVKYSSSVHPNEKIECETKITQHKMSKGELIGIFEGTGRVGDKEVITMTGVFAAIKPKKINQV